MTTFARYVNADDDAVRKTAQAIDAFHNEMASFRSQNELVH